jgi:hypothetical protein
MKRTPDSMSPERWAEFEAKATFLCSMNKDVDARNASKLRGLNQPIFKLIAVNSSSTAKNWSADKFRGIENIAYFALEAKVLIASNIWKLKGLVNGAPAVIKDVVWKEGKVPNKDLPEFIVVECLSYDGPPFFEEEEKRHWVPLAACCFQDDTHSHSRTGFPLKLAYAMTIHKSQGESLRMTAANIGICPSNFRRSC